MAITHGMAVAVNSILALKNFHVFLNVHTFNEKPGRIEQWCISIAKNWIERKAMWYLADLKSQIQEQKEILVFTNDDPASFVAVMGVAIDARSKIKSATELFDLITKVELQVAVAQRRKTNEAYS
jgi:hypothetical protein